MTEAEKPKVVEVIPAKFDNPHELRELIALAKVSKSPLAAVRLKFYKQKLAELEGVKK